jgi:uncharacterized protein GlcG (DUF336 family)
MKLRAFALVLWIAGVTAVAAAPHSRSRPAPRPFFPLATAADCDGVVPAGPCEDGGPGSFAAITADEVERLVRNASAAVDDQRMTIAVVDRAGRVLAVARKPAADPANDAIAIGLARTGALFSHNMAPLSSRTVRFISGVHFPPGVRRAPNGALYGVENTNRGCDLNVVFNPGKCIPRASLPNEAPCDSTDQRGCGTGPVTGKPDQADGHAGGHPAPIGLQGPANPAGLPVNPGGIPVYRVSSFEIVEGSLQSGTARVNVGGPSYLIGGIGVAGISPDAAEFAAFSAVAFAGGLLFPAPSFPLPEPGAVVIDGIRLPYVEQGLRPAGMQPGSGESASFTLGPRGGGCVANRYLVGPKGGGQLSAADVDRIVRQSVDAARKTRGAIRLPLNSYARMVIAVTGTNGDVLALYRMPDATVFSIDVAVAKARNVVWFSGPEGSADLPAIPPLAAISARTVGFVAQPLYPVGIDGTAPGPSFDLFVNDLRNPCSQGSQPANPNQNGIVFFAGSLPLYRGDQLVGGLGVSGDGVEQDDYVTFLGAEGFVPPLSIWADQFRVRNARLPFLKFPRQPEGVTESDDEPFDEP